MTRREARVTAVLSGLALVLYAALAHFFAKQTGDDSFIFYRIAANALAGHGPVFNPGEHVEAHSSPLWLAILVVGRALGAPFGPFAQVAGQLLAAIGIVFGVVVARRLGADPVGAALVAVLASLSGSIHYWAPSGLETALYSALVGAACAGIAGKRPWVWAIAVGLLGVTRPEGIFLVPIGITAYVIAHGRRSLSPLLLLVVVLPTGVYEIFRLVYFHAPLPNTYYAKATGPLLDRVQTGLDYAFWTLVLLVPSTFQALRAWKGGDPRPLATLILPGAITAAAIVGGGDWMWGHRLLVPAIAPIFGVAAAQARGLLDRRRPLVRALVTAGLLATAINDDFPWAGRAQYEDHFGFIPRNKVLKFKAWGDYVTAAELRFVRPVRTILAALAGRTMDPGERMEGTMTEVSRDVGAWLKQHYPTGTLLAVNHAGAVPFFAEMPAVDMTGLADWHIAHEVSGGLHHKFDPAYVLGRRPRAIILNSRTEPGKDGVWYHEGYWDGETALVHDPAFTAGYHAVPIYFRWEYSDRKGIFILIYERNEP
jgi:hypothetical protein